MKTKTNLDTSAALSASTNLRSSLEALKANEQALVSERQAQEAAIGAITLENLEAGGDYAMEEAKRGVRIRVREASMAKLADTVKESTRGLYVAFLELMEEVNESVANEKRQFRKSLDEFLAPMMPAYGGSIEESIYYRLTAPFERLLDSVQNLDNISPESERDLLKRAEFYLRRTGMLVEMVSNMEKADGRWITAKP